MVERRVIVSGLGGFVVGVVVTIILVAVMARSLSPTLERAVDSYLVNQQLVEQAYVLRNLQTLDMVLAEIRDKEELADLVQTLEQRRTATRELLETQDDVLKLLTDGADGHPGYSDPATGEEKH